MTRLLLVLLGGALGAGCRYGVSLLVASLIGVRQFPVATFLINVSGSFLIGVLAEWFDARANASPDLRAAILVGLLGGYTTFSSFSLETFNLLRDGAWAKALLYPVASLTLGLLAVWCGVQLARWM
ncbi:MAG: fluoride efflux transporter CrcB [Blastocatellia bacterium]|nr:fluoride efflux transporter CrcB [Blastocatellia bacterium]